MPVLPANPWDDLSPDEPLVLPSDRLAVEVYNERENARANPRVNRLIHTNLMPEPLFGPFDAPVVVLLLNPGVSEQDAKAHADPALRERLLANLRRDAPEERQQPHVHLVADISYPGADWWGDAVNRLTREVIDGRRLTRQRIAARLLAVQFFPYHSQTFDHGLLRLPSQDFGFALVRRAIARNALIIMRGAKYWLGAVPELARHPAVALLNAPINAALTPGNVGESVYQQLHARLAHD